MYIYICIYIYIYIYIYMQYLWNAVRQEETLALSLFRFLINVFKIN